MKIAIVGFDIEGKSTFEYLTKLGGHDITICDQNASLSVPDGIACQLGEGYLNDMDKFDVIVRTAGLQPSKILAKNPDVAERITTHINLFYGGTPTQNIIGVTGTKGKGTTSTLITELLKAAGKDVYLGGNIGVPPLSFVGNLTKESWVVLELSSFQLIDCHYAPKIGVCLMVVPEHLNWHADMHEYVTAKSQLFVRQKTDTIAIYNSQNELSQQIAAAGKGQKIPFMQPPGAFVENNMITIDAKAIIDVHELQLLGEHNWQNVCAAVTAAWNAGVQDIDIMREVLKNFKGLEHRLEFVREVNGVKYYNDSFGTTPETAIVAIQAFQQPKIVILGGSDKGADYSELASVVAGNNVRKALLIGETAPKIKAALDEAGFIETVDGGTNIDEIMHNVTTIAQPGDVVLLSTANASFDMFHDYKDRGNQFKQAVQALA